MPGTSGFCYACHQLCGGEDIAGSPVACVCCQQAGSALAPAPSPEPPVPGDGPPASGMYDPAWPDRPPQVPLG
jgi:hypothetical protein